MDKTIEKRTIAGLIQENALLREEVRVARKASDITAQLVVEQFVKIEKMLQRLEESEQRYCNLYQQSSQKEQLYESLLSSTPDAVAICNVNNQAIYINPSFTRIFGFSPDEVMGQNIAFIPECETARTDTLVRQVLSGQPVSYMETKRRRKDGEVLDATLSASCYLDHRGRPAGYVMILRDATERKRAELLVQKERETFFTILEKAPYGVAYLDKDERCLYLNPECVRIMGYHAEDIPTVDVWFTRAYPNPEYREKVVQAWKGGNRGNKAGRIFSVVSKDGKVKEVEFRRTLLEDGKAIVTLSDFTERRRSEEQVRRAKEEWERTFDAIKDVITIQDTQMRILRMNNMTVSVLGAPSEELIGKHCYEIFRSAEEPCAGCPTLLTLRDQKSHSAEMEHPHLGRVFLVTASPIFDTHGNFDGLVHSAKDITEKRKIEEELLKAQKLESLGILAGGIGHDFNNVLTAILGNISISKVCSGATEEILGRLDEAEKACLRARDLTHQLLTFSKGGAPIKKTTSILEIIKDSAAFALMGSNVRCEYHIAEGLWPAEIDEGQISRVINNLIINACQAMPNGGTVKIGAENITVREVHDHPVKPGRYIRVSVQDHGIGISPEHLSRIFDPYFTTKARGNGLGLATAYWIIKRHEGILTVESDLNLGTTFHAFLPAVQKEVPQARASSNKPVPGKGKILVMDDDEVIREVAGQMLNRLNYQTAFASDGAEAIELYRKAMASGVRFAAVLMDLTIPGGMGGKEAILKLKEIDPEVKAIVSSGYYTAPIMSNFSEYGFCDVIAKPYRIKELSETLHRVICGNNK